MGRLRRYHRLNKMEAILSEEVEMLPSNATYESGPWNSAQTIADSPKTGQPQILNLAWTMLVAVAMLLVVTLASASSASAQLSMLHASGNNIVDASGNNVLFEGSNLGSWLVMESYMSPLDGGSSHTVNAGAGDMYSVMSTLDSRFGVAEEQTLLHDYQEAWLTQTDADLMKANKLNVARIPVWWANFYTLANENNPTSSNIRPDAFAELDRAVAMLAADGIYTVIDMHGAFGSQSSASDTGQANSNAYWTSSADQANTNALWTIIANHYKGNPNVAGYDLLNEPDNAPSDAAVISAYNSIYSTIRAADPDHMLFIEACFDTWNWSVLPAPSVNNWTNVVYELHEYQFNGSQQKIETGTSNQVADYLAHKSYNVPVWIGEWNDFQYPAAWSNAFSQYENNQMGQSWWAWKAAHGTVPDSWGYYDTNNSATVPDISSDSAASIDADWKGWTTAGAFDLNSGIPWNKGIPPPPPSCGTTAVSGIITGTPFNIVNKGSGMCISSQSNSSGAELVQTPCATGQANQEWQFSQVAGSCYAVTNVGTNLVWDDTGSSSANGNLITVATQVAASASTISDQEWQPVSAGSGLWSFGSFTAYAATQAQTCLDNTNGSLTGGTQYQIWACQSGNVNQEYTLVQVGNQPTPVAPTGVTANAATSSQINLTWTASTTPGVSYSVFGSTTSGFTPSSSNQLVSGLTTTTYPNSGLAASTTYYYVVEAVNSTGTAASSQVSATTPPAGVQLPSAPTGLTASAASSSQINLTWTASTTSGVTYSVFGSTNSGFTPSSSNQLTSGLTSTSYSNSGLAAATTYYYVVESVNPAGESASNQATAMTQVPSQPSPIQSGGLYTITNHTSGMCVTDTNSSSSNGTPLEQTPCVSGQLNQEWKFTATSNGNYTVSSNSATSLVWDDTNGSTSNGNMIQLYTLAGNTNQQWLPTQQTGGLYTFTNLTSGACLDDTNGSTSSGTQFQQWACSANSNQEFTVTALGTGTAPLPPTGLATTAGNGQISLSWTASSGATSYNVYSGTSAGGENTAPIANVQSTSYTNTGLSNGTTYYYKVVAVNGVGASAQSAETSGTPTSGPSGNAYGGTPAAIPGTVYADSYDIGGQGVAFNTTSSNGSDNSWRTTGDGIDLEPNSDTTSNGADLGWTSAGQWFRYTVNVAQAGTYTIAVRVSSGASGGTFHIQNAAGVNLTGTITVPGTGGWQTWTTVETSATLSAGVQTLTISQDTGGWNINYLTFTNGISNPIPVAPTLTATAGTSQVSLSWTASSGAASYNVYRGTGTGGEGTTALATVPTGTTYTDTGVTAGTTYYYEVTAVNSAGSSPRSNEQSATPTSGGPGTGAYAIIPTSTFSSSSDVAVQATGDTPVTGDGGNEIGHIDSDGATPENSYIAFNSLDFGTGPGAGSVSVRMASQTPVGTADFHIDSPTGTLIASVTFPNTGGWGTYTTITVPVTVSTVGVHNVYIVFTGGPNPGNFHWFQFAQAMVPPAPGLTATPGDTQVTLSWAASSGASSYTIQRSTTSGGPYTTIATVPYTATTYKDTGLTDGTTYYYVATATSLAGTSGRSAQVTVTPNHMAPPAPTLSETGGANSVILSWTGSAPFATSYNVYRSTSPGSEGSSVYATVNAPTTSYTDQAVQAGTTYCYTVAAVDSVGTGAVSNEKCGQPNTSAGAPTNVSATVGNQKVYLLWTISIGATSYDVQRATSSGGPYTTVGTTSDFYYSDAGLTNGTTYYYQVAAVNGAGQSGYSSPTSATPAAGNASAVSVTVSSELNPKDDTYWYGGPHSPAYALAPQSPLTLSASGSTSGTVINVDPATTYQTMLGIGASLEDTSVQNFQALSSSNEASALNLLLSPTTGAGMDLFRIAIGASDFAGTWYTYDDNGGNVDMNLSNFSIQEDINRGIIATIKKAQLANPHVVFFASPWTPPAWMKTSGSGNGGTLLPNMYPVLAQYYLKFVQAYQAQGIPIYAMTLQNEPGVSAGYPSMTLSPQQEITLVQAIKSAFVANNITTKLWIFDHNFDGNGVDFPDTVLADPGAFAATDGTAFHDYSGDPSYATTVHNKYPTKPEFFTEHSNWGIAGMDRTAQYFQNWISSYNQWVPFANGQKGPSLSPFTPDATLLIDSASNGQPASSYWAIPEVYLTGQYAKFIEPGALRISSNNGTASSVTNVAFLNPDGNIVLVVMNQSGSSQDFTVVCQGHQFTGTLATGTMATYVWQ